MDQHIDSYSSKQKMYVSTDCIIFGYDGESLKLLIFKRRIKPYQGAWSLIGSFTNLDEDVDHAAKRVLKEITGLDNVFMQQLKTYSDPDRDPGYRCISVGQYALIRIDDHDKNLVEKHGAVWYEFKELPKLVLDHDVMVQDALRELRIQASYRPIGFELLPEKFTIPNLQRLFESIYQREFDSRNFRKKILSLDILIKLAEKDKSTSKKGAFLYRFDKKNYNKIIPFGIYFE